MSASPSSGFTHVRDGNPAMVGVSTTGTMGVEAEAMTGASTAALTIYDMCNFSR